jgi:hypothetical protein
LTPIISQRGRLFITIKSEINKKIQNFIRRSQESGVRSQELERRKEEEEEENSSPVPCSLFPIMISI